MTIQNTSETKAATSDDVSPLFIAMISLREAPQRREFFENGWNKCYHKSKGKLMNTCPYFHVVDRDPEGGLIGCTRSHLACYQTAIERSPKIEMALVFEDDVQPNSLLNDELAYECLDLVRAGWDVIRLHKTGICKVHGRLGDKYFHCSSFCGRGYFVSRALMEQSIKDLNKSPLAYKSMTPYTSYIAEQSSRHLTYYLSAITEGAFGSYNDKSGFGRQNAGVAFLQWTLNYTTSIESSVANAMFYFDMQSPLYNDKSFPHSTEFWRKWEESPETSESTMSMEWYRKNIGQYLDTNSKVMMGVLSDRWFNGGKSTHGKKDHFDINSNSLITNQCGPCTVNGVKGYDTKNEIQIETTSGTDQETETNITTSGSDQRQNLILRYDNATGLILKSKVDS